MNSVRIGSINLKTDLILAPMMDICTPSFRQLIIDEGGVGMIFTPMLYINQISIAPKTIIPHLEHIENQRPAAVQIVGAVGDGKHLQNAIELLNLYDFDVIDINSGCPSRRTMNSGGGAALLREVMDTQFNPDSCAMTNSNEFYKLIELAMKYSDKPISVKTRLGFKDEREILGFCKIFEDLGVEFLSIHGRTVEQKYSGEANLNMIKEVKETIEIPVIGNGDVRNYQTYKNMKDITKCDAVMIGRSAKGEPQIFSRITKSLEAEKMNQEIPVFPETNTIEYVRDLTTKNQKFIKTLSHYWNNSRFLLAETRRTVIWFIKGIKGYKSVRAKISKINNLTELNSYIFSDEFENDFIRSSPDAI